MSFSLFIFLVLMLLNFTLIVEDLKFKCIICYCTIMLYVNIMGKVIYKWICKKFLITFQNTTLSVNFSLKMEIERSLKPFVGHISLLWGFLLHCCYMKGANCLLKCTCVQFFNFSNTSFLNSIFECILTGITRKIHSFLGIKGIMMVFSLSSMA